MNTFEINNILSRHILSTKKFCGVFPIDLLPIKKIKRPCSFIMNTDESNSAGQHWVALFIPLIGNVEYFDSFGFKPLNHQILDFISINGGKYKYNSQQIQSNSSESCGKFCILFILLRLKKITFENFIKLFRKDKNYNEILIENLFKKISV